MSYQPPVPVQFQPVPGRPDGASGPLLSGPGRAGSPWPRRLQLIGAAVIIIGLIALVPYSGGPAPVIALLLGATGAVIMLRTPLTGPWWPIGTGLLTGAALLTVNHGFAAIAIVGLVLVVVGLCRAHVLRVRSVRFWLAVVGAVILGAVLGSTAVGTSGGYLSYWTNDAGTRRGGSFLFTGSSVMASDLVGATLAGLATGIALIALARAGTVRTLALVGAAVVAVGGCLVSAVRATLGPISVTYNSSGYVSGTTMPEVGGLWALAAAGAIIGVVAIVATRIGRPTPAPTTRAADALGRRQPAAHPAPGPYVGRAMPPGTQPHRALPPYPQRPPYPQQQYPQQQPYPQQHNPEQQWQQPGRQQPPRRPIR